MIRRAARGVLVALVTCPSRTAAQRLARWMICSHVAACVNVLGPATSFFWWQGKMDRAREHLLVIKTTRRTLPALRRGLVARHPYTVPELVAFSVNDGLPSYLRWVRRSCRSNS